MTILNKRVPETIDTLPFLHIKRTDDQDTIARSGLKKAVRLAKNVRNGADNQATASKLPSFDIPALLYHPDLAALRVGYFYELASCRKRSDFLTGAITLWKWRKRFGHRTIPAPS